jgi:protein-S-isoprenylcysteine O-methyltransferase Ste14
VTIKQDHQFITSGHYALVRHPIYTGLLTGFLGSAIALDRWRGIAAVILVFSVLWHKLRLEEQWKTSPKLSHRFTLRLAESSSTAFSAAAFP